MTLYHENEIKEDINSLTEVTKKTIGSILIQIIFAFICLLSKNNELLVFGCQGTFIFIIAVGMELEDYEKKLTGDCSLKTTFFSALIFVVTFIFSCTKANKPYLDSSIKIICCCIVVMIATINIAQTLIHIQYLKRQGYVDRRTRILNNLSISLKAFKKY